MKRWYILTFLLLSMVMALNPAAAATLAIVPSSETFVVGDSVQIELIVSGLTAGGPPSLREFDIDITFEPELAFKSYQFGNFLGDPNDPAQTFTDTDLYGPYFNLYEESLLSTSALDALQPASFTLATLTFEAVMEGFTNIEGDLYAFLDAFGDDLIEAHGPVKGAEIMINPVPIPPAILLLGGGVAGLAVMKRKKIMG
jgi:hypothetical protein